jgi:CcmD family protein
MNELLLAAADAALEGFEAVKGAPEESIAASPLVVAAYAFIWAAVLVYLLSLHRRQAALRAEIEELRAKVGRSDG